MKYLNLFIAVFLLHFAIIAQSSSTNNFIQNVGMNQSSPQSRLHISDDPQGSNCKPAILIESNIASSASGNAELGTYDKNGAGTFCGTPFVFRNNASLGGSTETTFNISANGKTVIGPILDVPGIGFSQLAVANSLGLYAPNLGNIRMGLLRQGSYTETPGITWDSPNSASFSFAYSLGSNLYQPILSLSPSNLVGINTESPEAAWHVVSQLSDPNSGSAGQVQGLLIQNNGYRNHDYALEIRTGQQPAGAAMQNGRVFTVSNAGTVHIGPNLNWTTPGETAEAFKLYVEGGIRTERVKVDVANLNGWADYVFEPGYPLMSTEELETYINTHHHLPGVPSAEEVAANGLDLAEINKILLEKIEELTLRVIELEKQF